MRPFLLTERRRTPEAVSIRLEKVTVRSVGNKKEFGFDKVFHQAATQGG